MAAVSIALETVGDFLVASAADSVGIVVERLGETGYASLVGGGITVGVKEVGVGLAFFTSDWSAVAFKTVGVGV